MKKGFPALFLFCLSVVFVSCKDSGEVSEERTFSAEYIAGTIRNNAGKSVAACWINNVLVELSNGEQNAFATGLDVKGHELFVSGYEQRNVSDPGLGFTHTPVYWKNGERSVVSDENATTIGIQVVKEDVYVAGTGFEQNSQKTRAVFWKNGIIRKLGGEQYSSRATGLFADSADVYVSGSEVVSEITRARLWKNGEQVALDTENGRSEAKGVTINGQDVFAFGNHTPFVFPYSSKPVYWKNGKMIVLDLPDGGSSASVSDVSFRGEVMYASGSYHSGLKYEACYWENGVFRKLPGESHAEARGISLIRTRARIIGHFHHGEAVAWDNGVLALQVVGAEFNKILYK